MIAATFLLAAFPVHAQDASAAKYLSPSERSVELLKERLRMLTELTGADAGEPGMRITLDAVTQFTDDHYNPPMRLMVVWGWAFSCEEGAKGYPTAVDMALDYTEFMSSDAPLAIRTGLAFFDPRPDVKNIIRGTWPKWYGDCLPEYPGFGSIVDITNLTPGPHKIAAKAWDKHTGRSTKWFELAFTR